MAIGPSLKSPMILHQAKVVQVGSCLKPEVMLEWSRMVFRVSSLVTTETQRGFVVLMLGFHEFPYFWMFHNISEDQAVLTWFILRVVCSNVWILDCSQAVKVPVLQRSSLQFAQFAHTHGWLRLLVPWCLCLCTSLILIPASCWKPLCLLPIAQLLRTQTTNAHRIHQQCISFQGAWSPWYFICTVQTHCEASTAISIFFVLFLNLSAFSFRFLFQLPFSSPFLE